MLYISTKRKTMNFEIAGVWFQQIHTTLESAKSTFPHDCKTSIESCEENDGGPYGSLNNATSITFRSKRLKILTNALSKASAASWTQLQASSSLSSPRWGVDS